MKKVIYTYGLIAGGIVSLLMLATVPMLHNDLITNGMGEIVGYTTMVIALSMVFFGIRSYRDNHSDGAITFGKGVQIGLLISLIAALMYALTWEFTFQTMMPDFIEKMSATYREKIQASGLPASEMKAKLEQTEKMWVWYQNPLIRFGMTLMEILPVGILITLISAALLRKKNFLPSTTTETI